MQVSVNIDELVKELAEYKKTVEESMKRMVVTFAYKVTISASRNTPIGDDDRIENDPNYANFYYERMQEYDIPMRAGFHRGAWTYAEGSDEADIDNIIYPDAASNVKTYAQRQYKVGDEFYIAAVGPGYAYLDSGKNWQAPEGIMKPTENDIMNIYSLNLVNYYNGSEG